MDNPNKPMDTGKPMEDSCMKCGMPVKGGMCTGCNKVPAECTCEEVKKM